jgi:hypothetical protein
VRPCRWRSSTSATIAEKSSTNAKGGSVRARPWLRPSRGGCRLDAATFRKHCLVSGPNFGGGDEAMDAEHFPAAAGDRSIRQAKARVASASESATDSCNFVPDSFGLADFGPACQAHDDCYSSSTDRLVCDLLLLRLLREACNVYPAGSSLQLTCYTVASIYFVGGRLFGGFFYTGTGSRLYVASGRARRYHRRSPRIPADPQSRLIVSASAAISDFSGRASVGSLRRHRTAVD